MPTELQRLKAEAVRAHQYAELCVRASIDSRRARHEYSKAADAFHAYKKELSVRLSGLLTDEFHAGVEYISVCRIMQLTLMERVDLLEILPELMPQYHNGYFRISSLRQLTY